MANRKKTLLLFLHIEKCAGTSLVKKFRKEISFSSCEAISKTNSLTLQELRKTLLLHPHIQLISGHNVYPSTAGLARRLGYDVKTFTVIREPIQRLLSNYTYDVQKGKCAVSLDEYIDIEWKRNYLLRFLGEGDVTKGREAAATLDYLMTVEESETSVSAVLGANGVVVSNDYHPENHSRADVPSDVRVPDGIRVGKYRISERNYEKLIRSNEEDLSFFHSVQADSKRRSRLRELERAMGPEAQRVSSALGTKFRMSCASAHRNFIYKPVNAGYFGYYVLPRNAAPADQVKSDEAFR